MSLPIPQYSGVSLPDYRPIAPAEAEPVSFVPVILADTLPEPDRPRYVCEWERPDSPTRGLSDAALREYYAANGAAGDCRFALRDGSSVPADLQAVYRALLAELATRKAKPADRRLIAELRTSWRDYADGRPYIVPTFEGSPKPARKVSARCCPHCGGTL